MSSTTASAPALLTHAYAYAYAYAFDGSGVSFRCSCLTGEDRPFRSVSFSGVAGGRPAASSVPDFVPPFSNEQDFGGGFRLVYAAKLVPAASSKQFAAFNPRFVERSH